MKREDIDILNGILRRTGYLNRMMDNYCRQNNCQHSDFWKNIGEQYTSLTQFIKRFDLFYMGGSLEGGMFWMDAHERVVDEFLEVSPFINGIISTLTENGLADKLMDEIEGHLSFYLKREDALKHSIYSAAKYKEDVAETLMSLMLGEKFRLKESKYGFDFWVTSFVKLTMKLFPLAYRRPMRAALMMNKMKIGEMFFKNVLIYNRAYQCVRKYYGMTMTNAFAIANMSKFDHHQVNAVGKFGIVMGVEYATMLRDIDYYLLRDTTWRH